MALPVNVAELEPLGVCALDGLFPEEEVSRLIQTVHAIPLYYLNHSTYQQTHELYGHWEYPLVVIDPDRPRDVADELHALDDSLRAVQNAWKRTQALLPADVTLVNCYVNGYTYGTDGYPHFEVPDPRAAEQRSVLIYCTPRWDPAWGGETVFFDKDGDITAAILPKPGRVLIFRGDVLHVARAPSRFCPMERRVLVFKAWTGDLPPPRKRSRSPKRLTRR